MHRMISIFTLGLMLIVWALGSLAVSAEEAPSPNVQEYYVAPEARGTGDGLSEANAAYFREFIFWFKLQLGLRKAPSTVYFLPGEYVFSKDPKDGKDRGTLRLENMGHVENHLTIQGLYPEGTVFMSDPEEPADKSKSIDLLYFNGRNTTFRYLHFTGEQHMGYTTRFLGQNVLIEHSTWIDLPRVYYGASGTAYDTTHHIIWKDNVFKRVGLDAHAHMIYNAYGPQHIYVIDNYFEDSAGEYVRFRDQTDYVVVYGSTFKSTGTFVNNNMPFVTAPLFNDDDPSNPGPNPRFEYFGTHFIIANNTFIYPDDNSPGTRQVVRFLNSGYSPPGVSFLLDVDEAKVLLRGTTQEKRALMKENLGIDGEQVYLFGNTYEGKGSKRSVVYYAYANYGSKSRGWSSPIDITDTVNSTPVVNSAAEAMMFWETNK